MPLRNLILVAISIVISLACYSVASKNRYANLFAEAMDLVDKEALHEVPRKSLFNSAMSGMLAELDEYSVFISGDAFDQFDEDVKQEFGGVGMYVETNPDTNRLFVLAPIPGTPAFEAGLQVGDEIVSIEGTSTEGMNRGAAVELLRGPINEPVSMIIERDGVEMEKRVVRAAIPVPSVYGDYRNLDGTWNYFIKDHPQIGYVRLLQFGEKSDLEIESALKEIEGKVDGLILDLRNNSGGLLESAVNICDLLIDKDQMIVSTRGRNQQILEETRARNVPMVNPKLPIVLLVNRNSASASEIVAGCLQDHKRAIIIGEQTWGKGTVQNVIPMQRDESALKLTTASYWRPSGVQIDRHDPVAQKTKVWGVQPNKGFEVEMTEEEIFDNLRQRSLRDLEGLMPPGSENTFQSIRRLRLRMDEAIKSANDLDGSGDTAEPNEHDKSKNDKSKNDDPKNDDPKSEKTDAPEPDEKNTTPDATQQDDLEEVPYVDRPVDRAIEYFRSYFLQQQQKAA